VALRAILDESRRQMAKNKRGKHFRYTQGRPIIAFPEDFWSEGQPLVTFLRTFHTIHREKPIARPDALTILDGLDTRPLLAEHTGAKLLGVLLGVIVFTIHKRAGQQKRAFGGRARPLQFDPAELAQTLPDPRTLPTTLHPLCDMLLKDVWTCVRLAWAAQDLYARKSGVWVTLHRLVGIVMLRILLVWRQIRRFNGPWVAVVCLRWALRQVWGTLFGEPVKLTRAAKSLLTQEALSVGQEWQMWGRLREESKAGAELPAPFATMVLTWLAGDLPPPYQSEPLAKEKVRFRM
jgi:hypothetical protein